MLVRKKLAPDFQQIVSNHICDQLTTLKHYKEAQHIGFYCATQGEVDLNTLWIFAAAQGKKCYFPRMLENKKLLFFPAIPGSPFTKNRYGIEEPEADALAAMTIHQLDLVFLPLVAFDKRGNRLGYGAGYYDRSLQGESKRVLVGVGYEFQRQPIILPEAWDVPLTAIITEKNVYWRKK